MTTRSRYTAAITDKPWWLAGGINTIDCWGAYQPRGASSYEASKVNLNVPGTRNATNGTAYPTWTPANGWQFTTTTASDTEEILFFTAPYASEMTIAVGLIRINPAGAAGDAFFADSARVRLQLKVSGDLTVIYNGQQKNINSTNYKTTLFNSWIWNKNGVYINGKSIGTYTPAGSITPANMKISRAYSTAGSFHVYCVGIYCTTLSSMQIAALHTAMNAL